MSDQPPLDAQLGLPKPSDCTQRGWYWYCDVHDTHGNADSEDEARFVADAHEEYFDLQDPDDEGCSMIVMDVQAGWTPGEKLAGF